MDSRALLLAFLATDRRPRCITWGLRSAPADPANDAAVAKVLAAAAGVEHRYFPIDDSNEEIREVLSRFLVAGEGRSEDFGAYADGLVTWKQLFESGVAGVIRGDEPGWSKRAFHSESYVRRQVKLRVLSDYPASHLINQLGLAAQSLPPELMRRDAESLRTYRDRLSQMHSLPTSLAALSDVKTPYVEIVNPFLSRWVWKVVRSLPDHLREHRRALATFVRAVQAPMCPSRANRRPSAATGISLPCRSPCRDPGASSVRARRNGCWTDELLSASSPVWTISPPATCSAGCDRPPEGCPPTSSRAGCGQNAAIHLSPRELAFRLYIASRMVGMLARDAAAAGRIWRSDTVIPGGR